MHPWVKLVATRPSFRRLWLSGVVSLVGDWLGFVAVSLLTVDHGGGPFALAVLLAAHHLPHALLAPVAGVIADRMDRKRLLVVANVAEGLLTLVAALAASGGHAAIVTLIILVRGAVGAFVVPAESAALPRILHVRDRDDDGRDDHGEDAPNHANALVDANALVSATWSVTFVIGMAAGGALAVFGPVIALVLDAASFGIAALLLAPIPALVPEGAGKDVPRTVRGAFAAMSRDVGEGLAYARRDPSLLRAVFAKSPLAIAGGAGWITLNLVAADVRPLGTAAVSLGILQAVRGVGTGIGPLAGSALLARGQPSGRVLHIAATLGIGAMALFALCNHPIWLLATALVWGVGSGANWVVSTAQMQRLAEDRVMGRLAATDNLATTLAQVVGALVGGALVAVTSVAAHAVWLGAAVGAISWIALARATEARSA